MEHYCFHSRDFSLLDPKTGSRDPVDEASEPKQGPEIFHVLSSHRLHYWINSMRHYSLATM